MKGDLECTRVDFFDTDRAAEEDVGPINQCTGLLQLLLFLPHEIRMTELGRENRAF